MADYDLSGLNTREFEHLIQAIATKIVAPGVKIYGDGKDGGREATYSGKMDYPSRSAPWNGYLVIQAKFLQRPGQTDQSRWALEQLDRELKKYAKKDGKYRRPEFYIFATNAIFSSVQGSGTNDRADELFESYRDSLKLKGWDVWHYDRIRAFLDGQSEVRERYSNFITNSDVFAEVLRRIRKEQPEFEKVMARFVQKQLIADQVVNLGQAGDPGDERTYLTDVFVDLQASDVRTEEPPPEPTDGLQSLARGFLATVLEEAGQFLDERTISVRRAQSEQQVSSTDTAANPESSAGHEHHGGPGPGLSEMSRPAGPRPGRLVLIGGPGQGKTTISQLVSQVYRGSILSKRPSHTLAPDASRILESVRILCERENIDLPAVRRYPFRLVLSQFAKALADGTASSIVDFVAGTINRAADGAVKAADIRDWLGAYPWLIILDGLDEVPASSNRREVMDAIEEFWVDVADCEADVMAIATTRPQGYSQEFSPADFRHLHLTPFSPKRAQHYGRRLAEARYPDGSLDRDRVIEALVRASEEPATARLMRSPLQVAIMSTLVDRLGDPPSQRWELFHKYYEVIYGRELAKGGSRAALLREHRKHIEAIHHCVGIRLQIAGERAGSTDAYLEHADFQRFVRSRLASVGHGEDDLEHLTRQISEAALQRLVFLVAPVEGKVGFEIRSLQEFMAGEAIMAIGDEDSGPILKAIAPIAYWRNVFLFAAGNWIDRRETAVADLIAICVSLNEGEPFGTALLEGSRLALDLLEDGLARQYPERLRSIARVALRLIELPPEDSLERLASVFDEKTEVIYKSSIEKIIKSSSVFDQLSAWILLKWLSEGGKDFARQMLESRWPDQPTDRLEILRAFTRGPKARSLPFDRVSSLIPDVTYYQLTEAELPLFFGEQPRLESPPAWYRELSSLLSRPNKTDWSQKADIRFGAEKRFELEFIPVGDGPHRRFASIGEMPTGHPSWRVITAAARFVAEPSAKLLAQALRELADQWGNRDYVVSIPTGYIPWPLSECIVGGAAEDFRRLAERSERGELGDLSDWMRAERAWAASGVDLESASEITDDRWPFDRDSLVTSFPFNGTTIHIDLESLEPSTVDKLLEFFEALPEGRVRSEVADIILEVCAPSAFPAPKAFPIPASPMLRLAAASQRKRIDIAPLAKLRPEEAKSPEWLELFDLFGREFQTSGFNYQGSKLAEILAAHNLFNPGRRGLINMLGMLTIMGYEIADLTNRAFPPGGSEYESLMSLLVQLAVPIPDAGCLERLLSHARSVIAEAPEYIRPLIDVAERRLKGTRLGAEFLVRLLEFWPPERWLARGRTISFLAGEASSQRDPNSLSALWEKAGFLDR